MTVSNSLYSISYHFLKQYYYCYSFLTAHGKVTDLIIFHHFKAKFDQRSFS